MKRVIFGIIAVLTVFAMISCDNGTTSTKKSNLASLTSLKFGSDDITPLGSAVTALGTDLSDLSAAQTATYTTMQASKDVAVTAVASAKAKVEVGVTDSKTPPTTFAAPGSVTIKAGGYVVIKVTSEDGKVINYYVVAIELSGTNTSLSAVQIEGGVEATTVTGSRADTIAGVTAFARIDLADSKKTQAEVTLTKGASFNGTMKVVKVSGTAVPTEADFQAATAYSDTAKPKITFADQDKLYVQMVAENGTTVMYYGYRIFIGWDASLSNVIFTDAYIDLDIDVDRVGAPKTTVALLDELAVDSDDLGKIQFQVKQPSDGFLVKAVPNDADAKSTSISLDGTFTDNIVNGDDINGIIFKDGDALYVKIVSMNEQVTNFYKIMIILKRSVQIAYGTPATINANAPDAIWNTVTEWLPINRINTTEGSGYLEMEVGDRSFGQAKLLWDEDGLWVYAQVWEKTISETGGEHTKSSVELFVNEAYSDGVTTGTVASSANTNGGQFRVGANGELTGSPASPQRDTFQALNQANAKKWTNNDFPYPVPVGQATGANVRNGYVVIFHAPWMFPNLHPLVDQKTISIELQINACGDEGTRVGVLNWNNENSNSYASLKDYGEAVLNLNGQALGPQKPVITKQPANGAYPNDASKPLTLTINASAADAGVLSYEWFKATSATEFVTGATSLGAGTPVNDTTDTTKVIGSSYTPASTTAGNEYYFVKVTTTLGAKTRTINSNMASVRVYDKTVVNKFDLDLSGVRTTGWASGTSQGNRLDTNKTPTANEVEWAFTGGDQRVAIALTEAQIDDVMVASSLKITVTGTSTGTAAAAFRYYLGNHTSGSGWNGTNASNNNAGSGQLWSAIIGEQTIEFSGNKSRATVGSWLLRSGGTTETINITKITIEIVY